MEPIVERIAVWIKDAIDGAQDEDQTITLAAVRPTIVDWNVEDYKNNDAIIEIIDKVTLEKAGSKRKEVAEWKIYGIIRELPANTAADTHLCRMCETIRRVMFRGNVKGQACGGLALNIDCPEDNFSIMTGGIVAEVTVQVQYWTAIDSGYRQ